MKQVIAKILTDRSVRNKAKVAQLTASYASAGEYWLTNKS